MKTIGLSFVIKFVLFALLSTVSVVNAASDRYTFSPMPDDPCRRKVVPLFKWQAEIDRITVSGGGVDIYRIPGIPSPIPLKEARPLVLIINGNGFGLHDYDLLATHLASIGFLVAVAQRPSPGDPVLFILDTIEAVLDYTDQIESTRVALIGHSYGGEMAVKATVLNKDENLGFNIKAVVGLATTVSAEEVQLTVEHVPAYMLIYGSQDQDVDGLGGEASDPFAAYDLSGTESSTTCETGGICTVTPGLDRTMVYVHGATHNGLLNKGPHCSFGACTTDYKQFLEPTDQLCITKAYTEAFLRWTLADDQAYKKIIRDQYRPPSIQDIVTSDIDALGNPSGSPLSLRIQSSPAKRSVINNFESGNLNVAPASFGTQYQLMEEGAYLGFSANVRHQTRALLVGWSQDPTWQLIALSVPINKRDSSSYTHISLRLGQIDILPPADTENPFNTEQQVLLGLNGGSAISSWLWLDPVPANDRRPSGKPQSVMSTYRIPLSNFSNAVNKQNIEAIFLAFPGGTQGTLVVDSIEWLRD